MRILDGYTANKIRDGDVQAFEKLINQHKDKVFSYCLRHVGDYHQAEEIAQEVFIKVFRKIDTYDYKKAALSTWIYAIAYKTCLSFYRSNQTIGQAFDDIACTIIEYPSAEDEYFEASKRKQWLEAINTLALEEKDLVLLKAYFDLKYDEIGRLKGIPTGTVKSRLFQIRSKLRKMMGEEND